MNSDILSSKTNFKFSSRLLNLVKKNGLKNKEFAKIIDISENAATNYLKKGRIPPAEILAKISVHFKISLDWLLEDVIIDVSNEQSQDYSNAHFKKFNNQAMDGPSYDGVQSTEKTVHIQETMDIASAILLSQTEYSKCLNAIIKTLHRSITNEKRMNNLESRIAALEVEID